MEVFDYDMDDEECDRLLEEAGPCEECGEIDTLALVAITTGEHFGTLLIFCVECSRDEESSTFSLEKATETLYA